MQGTPHGIDLGKIKSVILQNTKVENVHNLHVWQLNDKDIFLDAHIQLFQTSTTENIDDVRTAINHELEETFDIHNTVLQIEYNCE